MDGDGLKKALFHLSLIFFCNMASAYTDHAWNAANWWASYHVDKGNFHLTHFEPSVAYEEFDRAMDLCIQRDLNHDCYINALWGRALSAGIMGGFEEAQRDLAELMDIMNECTCSEEDSDIFVTNGTPVPVKKSSINITPDRCAENCREVAFYLKSIVVAMVKRSEVALLFNEFIDALEKKGISCCLNGGLIKNCIKPLFDKADEWFKRMPNDPHWTDPRWEMGLR